VELALQEGLSNAVVHGQSDGRATSWFRFVVNVSWEKEVSIVVTDQGKDLIQKRFPIR